MGEATQHAETASAGGSGTKKRGCILQALENLFWLFAACLPLMTLASWVRYGPVLRTLLLTLLLATLVGMLVRAHRKGRIRQVLHKLAIGLTLLLLIVLVLVAYQFYLAKFEH